MYDELVKRLRELHPEEFGDAWDFAFACQQAMHEAADAIETINRRETPMKITEIHVDEYYCPACGAENNCDQGYVQDAYCPACGQRLLPQPPKEET